MILGQVVDWVLSTLDLIQTYLVVNCLRQNSCYQTHSMHFIYPSVIFIFHFPAHLQHADPVAPGLR